MGVQPTSRRGGFHVKYQVYLSECRLSARILAYHGRGGSMATAALLPLLAQNVWAFLAIHFHGCVSVGVLARLVFPFPIPSRKLRLCVLFVFVLAISST